MMVYRRLCVGSIGATPIASLSNCYLSVLSKAETVGGANKHAHPTLEQMTLYRPTFLCTGTISLRHTHTDTLSGRCSESPKLVIRSTPEERALSDG